MSYIIVGMTIAILFIIYCIIVGYQAGQFGNMLQEHNIEYYNDAEYKEIRGILDQFNTK